MHGYRVNLRHDLLQFVLDMLSQRRKEVFLQLIDELIPSCLCLGHFVGEMLLSNRVKQFTKRT